MQSKDGLDQLPSYQGADKLLQKLWVLVQAGNIQQSNRPPNLRWNDGGAIYFNEHCRRLQLC